MSCIELLPLLEGCRCFDGVFLPFVGVRIPFRSPFSDGKGSERNLLTTAATFDRIL